MITQFVLHFMCNRKLVVSLYSNIFNPIMTTIQLNAEVLRNLSVVAEDENLLKCVAKYLRKLVAEKENSTQMTKEEFYAKLERGERAYEQGECHEMLPDEDLTTYLKRLGYDI